MELFIDTAEIARNISESIPVDLDRAQRNGDGINIRIGQHSNGPSAPNKAFQTPLTQRRT